MKIDKNHTMIEQEDIDWIEWQELLRYARSWRGVLASFYSLIIMSSGLTFIIFWFYDLFVVHHFHRLALGISGGVLFLCAVILGCIIFWPEKRGLAADGK